MPTPDYHADTPSGSQWLLDNVPTYSEWYRLSLFWRLSEGMLAAARVDAAWPQDGRSVSSVNEGLRELLAQYLESQFSDAPELLARVLPDYPPLAKRILLDNGIWAATLKRDHVELITDAIDEITPTGVVAGGQLREVDVIVYATGFHASEFLTPLRIKGRGGMDLHEHWDGDARAYLGLTVPGFPNLFCMYGPNTNLVANGSIIFFGECEVQYILSAIRLLLERDANALDCRRAVHDAFNVAVDEANSKMAVHVARVLATNARVGSLGLRPALGARLFECSAHQHLREVTAELRRRVEVGGRVGAVVGHIGGVFGGRARCDGCFRRGGA
jgi:4-hydroxyacetophenone monooxygenase